MKRLTLVRHGRILLPMLMSASLAAVPPFAAAGLDEAQQYYDAGDFKSAVIELKGVLQADNRSAQARLLLGRIYLDMQAGAEAEQELRRAEELGADPNQLRLDMADAMLLQRKFPEVLRSLAGSGTGAANAEKAALAARRGFAYAGMNNADAAQRSFKEALDLDPDNEEASLGELGLEIGKLGGIEGAEPLVTAFLAKFPDNIEALLVSAELHRRQGDFEAALAAIDRVLRLRPQELRAIHGRAGVLIAQGKLQDAKVELNGADAVREGLVMTEYLRGVVALQEKDYDGAKRHLELVLRAAPGHVQSQLALGIISFWQNNLQIAEEYLGRIVPMMPDDFGSAKVDAAKILGAVRLKLQQPEKAIEVLEPLAALSSDAQLMALLGSAYLAQGEPDRGLEWLSRAVETSPDTVGLRTLLASALLAGGETDRAISELQAAVDLGEDTLQLDVLRVLTHIRKGEQDQALSVAIGLEENRPGDAVALNLTGLAYLAAGELEKAVERFERALATDPKFSTARFNLARVDMARGDAEGAKQRLGEILAEDPKNTAAMLSLAGLAGSRGDTDEKISWLEKARDADPKDLGPGAALVQHYLGARDPQKALSVASELADRFPDNPEALKLLARAQVLSGDTSSAMRALESLDAERPEDADVKNLIGAAKWKAGDLSGASLAYDQAIRLDPGNVVAYQGRAGVAIDQKRTTEALGVAKRLQQALPTSEAGFELEGQIYLNLKRPDMAAKALEGAIALKKDSGLVVALASAYAADGREGEAASLLERWLADHPTDPAALGALAQLQVAQEQRSEAIATYERLVAASPTNFVALNNLAWLYQEAGDGRALEVAKRVYDIDPWHPDGTDTYGWVLLKSGKTDEAISVLHAAHTSHPNDTTIAYHLAVALNTAGRGGEAADVLRALLRESQEFKEAQQARELLEAIE